MTLCFDKVLKKLGLVVSMLLTLSLINSAPSLALEQRVIDVATVTWSRAGSLPGSVQDVKSQIDTVVGPMWKQLTTIYGDPTDKRIEFVSGQVLPNPIQLNFPIPCDSNFNTWTSSVRTETYKRLGISDWQNRYLVIMTPNAGCIWSGRALIGSVDKAGGVVALHNSAEGFIVAHELGHLFGLGHSNLLRCAGGAVDGPWSSCSAVEYGGSVDIMGNVNVSTPLSTYHQWRMGLLDKNDIRQSVKSESIEINASDVYGKPRAIFVRDGSATYWIEYRKAAGTYKSGLVIYRTDPPPSTSIQSPNPTDAMNPASMEVGTDIWMMNLDNFVYGNSRSSGSMTLPSPTTQRLYSGNISISATAGASDSSVIVNITRQGAGISTRKPAITSTNTWRAPDAPVLDSGFTSAVGDVAEYEARIDGVSRTLSASQLLDWTPTYLNPFTAPQVLQVKDLPEGQYALAIRVRDYTGTWSPWSDAVNVSIDRSYPIVGSNFQVSQLSPAVVGLQLTDTRDEGSGLCLTQLVNTDGWVFSRSTTKTRPLLNLTFTTNNDSKIQVFDCLGNGRQGSAKFNSTFQSADQFKRSGKWIAAGPSFPTGSIKCQGKCTAYATLSGSAGIALGAGTAEINSGALTTKTLPASKIGESYAATPVNMGTRKASVRIIGSNFTLVGSASVNFSIVDVANIQNSVPMDDMSLTDPIQKTLNGFGFNGGDFTSEWTVVPMTRGTTLDDPTLDLCSATFGSELDRKERRQVVVTKNPSPYMFLSTEVVRYKSTSAAAGALNELKTSYNNCVKNGGGTERDGVFTKYVFLNLPKFTSPLVPDSQRVVVHAQIGEGSAMRYLFAAYQYNGEMFTGLYVVKPAASAFTPEEISRWLDVAGTMAQRLNTTVR